MPKIKKIYKMNEEEKSQNWVRKRQKLNKMKLSIFKNKILLQFLALKIDSFH